jgi:ABC-type lipoprotein release transport system permease subunit
MKLLLRLAWRNLWRNKRRTIITILAVTFATLFAIAMRGVQLGTYEENISFALRLFSGFVQIQAPGFQDNPSLHKSFVFDEQLHSELLSIHEITGYAPRVYADGLASFHNNSLGCALFGVIPERERTVTTYSTKIAEGHAFDSDTSDAVVLGYKLLDNLNAKIGDAIVILAQGYDGTLGNQRFRIVGTVKTGSSEFDGMAIFMGLRTLQDLLEMGDRIHVLALSLNDVYAVEEVTNQLNSTLETSKVRALPWQRVMPDLQQSIQLDNVSGIIFLGILIVVVAFGILNTVLMSVTERFREFGVLLSLGMPQVKLVWVVFFETIIIAFIGMFVGNILAVGVNYYLIVHPIEFGGEYGSIMEEYGFLPIIKSALKPSSFANTTLSILIISLLSTIYPLYRTFKLEPLKGIRYT